MTGKVDVPVIRHPIHTANASVANATPDTTVRWALRALFLRIGRLAARQDFLAGAYVVAAADDHGGGEQSKAVEHGQCFEAYAD